MWVVRARLVGERVDEVGVNGGAVVMTSRTLPVVELFHNDSLYAGYYQHNWDCRNRNGQPVPAGFYRVYFKVGSFLTWHDIFIYRSLNDLPPGLRRAG